MNRNIIVVCMVLMSLLACGSKKEANRQVKEKDSSLEQFEKQMESAEMKVYINKKYNVAVTYPDFFEADTVCADTTRFFYQKGKGHVVALSMFVEPNIEGWDVSEAVSHLTDSVTDCLIEDKDFFVLFGKAAENSGALFMEKCYLIDDNWYDLTIFYREEISDAIERLINTVVYWKPWVHEPDDVSSRSWH